MHNYFKMYNADKCIFDAEVSCVSDPIQASLREILLYEIRLLAYYTLKLKEFNFEYNKYAKHIIDGVCVASLNMEINRNEFSDYLLNLIDLRCVAQKNYIDYSEKNNLDLQILKAYTDKCSDFNFIDALKQGELQNIQKNKILDKDKKSLYDILYIIIQNACRNIAQINLFKENEVEYETFEIIKLISSTNFKSTQTEKLKNRIEKASKINYNLYKKLKELSSQKFGIPKLSEVKLDYKKGKAILVTGDSLMDLYDLLKYVEGTDINVYTHDALILAHCYDEFKKFKNLVGHYQKSIDNLEMDFSSFPGVILITRNGNGNYLNIIRGLIYTTNEIGGKGVTVIKDGNFENLVNQANERIGFKEDKEFGKIQIGYNFDQIEIKINEIIEKIDNNEIKTLYMFGLLNNIGDLDEYFKHFIDKINDNSYIISLSYNANKENLYHIDSYYDYSLTYKILEKLEPVCVKKNIPINIIMTEFNLSLISRIFDIIHNFQYENIYIPNRISDHVNPQIIETLRSVFGLILLTGNVGKDLKIITSINKENSN